MEKNMKHATNLIIIASALLTTGALFAQQAAADETSQVLYEMVVVGNHASGDLVTQGNYQTAIDRITRKYSGHPFATATNLCAALSMLGEFDQAEPYCDEAIKLADKSPVPAPRSWKARNQMTTQQAQAYSNRGVMRMLSGDNIGAEQDFQVAIERNDKLRAPAQNLARVQLDSTGVIVAKVSH
jgi:Flp pilus assembly protein TadD